MSGKLRPPARNDKKLKERQFWYIIGLAVGFLFLGVSFYNAFLHLITRNYSFAIFFSILFFGSLASIWVFGSVLDRFSSRVIFRERREGERSEK